MGPYGQGNAYVVLWAIVGDAEASLRLHSAATSDNNAFDTYLEVRAVAGRAKLVQVIAGVEQTLADWPLVDGRLRLYLDAWSEGTLLWLDSRQPRQLPGGVLDQEAGVAIELSLPNESKLEKLEIWPEQSAYRQRLANP